MLTVSGLTIASRYCLLDPTPGTNFFVSYWVRSTFIFTSVAFDQHTDRQQPPSPPRIPIAPVRRCGRRGWRNWEGPTPE